MGSPVDQFQAMVVGQHALLLFERTFGGDDQPNLIKIGVFNKMIRQDEVPIVNGIKTSKKQTYFLHLAKVGNCLGT